VPGLPRTNNDPEQCFGRHRYHERRASGRKAASPGLVLRGEARPLAASATRRRDIRVIRKTAFASPAVMAASAGDLVGEVIDAARELSGQALRPARPTSYGDQAE
jgi:hypothetical protein